MTVLDDRQLVNRSAVCARPVGSPRRTRVAGGSDRPAPTRPASAPLQYRGGGVRMSHAPHTRRAVSTPVSIALAGVAALITLWLGCLANFSGTRPAAPAQLPDRLAVVQVQAGETLQHLAGRVAPDAPVGQVVERIRELNKLDSSSVDVGQTLIAPLG